jgi:prevent-host-death family protein
MAEVGIKLLKDHLSEYLQRARGGERIVITDRGAPCAVLLPFAETADEKYARSLVHDGGASWAGGKSKGAARPPAVAGSRAVDAILDERR